MKTSKTIFIGCALLLFFGNGYAQRHLEVVEPASTNNYQKVDTYDNDEVFITVDRTARFPGGEDRIWKYIDDNMQYPKEALKNGIQGQVGVKFVVRSTGDITDVRVSRSVDPLLDDEAVRIVQSMPKWIPADLRGQAVSTSQQLFILFKAAK